MAQYNIANTGTVVSKPNYQMAFNEILGIKKSGGQGALGSKSGADNRNSGLYNLPVDNQGNPFMNYKQPANFMTDNFPEGTRSGTYANQLNVAFDNTEQRGYMTEQGVPLQNNANKDWVFTNSTLGNPSFSGLSCTSDSDCVQYNTGNVRYSCNSNYQPWQDAKGNQPGSTCVPTVYPELDFVDPDGNKKYSSNYGSGGFGQQCTTDNDCTGGYVCNPPVDSEFASTTDVAGQKGYCTLKYKCGSETRYLPVTYNSDIPFFPFEPKQNNNNGQGFPSEEACLNGLTPVQDCVEQGGKWFRVYPGYCPVTNDYRQGGQALGQFSTSKKNEIEKGIILPSGFTDSKPSSIGSSRALGQLSMKEAEEKDLQPLDLLAKWNGKSQKTIQAQNMLFGR